MVCHAQFEVCVQLPFQPLGKGHCGLVNGGIKIRRARGFVASCLQFFLQMLHKWTHAPLAQPVRRGPDEIYRDTA